MTPARQPRHHRDTAATARDPSATHARPLATHSRHRRDSPRPIRDPCATPRDPLATRCGQTHMVPQGRMDHKTPRTPPQHARHSDTRRDGPATGGDPSATHRRQPARAGDPSATHRRHPATGPRRAATHPRPIGDILRRAGDTPDRSTTITKKLAGWGGSISPSGIIHVAEIDAAEHLQSSAAVTHAYH